MKNNKFVIALTLMKTVWFCEPVMRGLSFPSTSRSSSTGHLHTYNHGFIVYCQPPQSTLELYFSRLQKLVFGQINWQQILWLKPHTKLLVSDILNVLT